MGTTLKKKEEKEKKNNSKMCQFAAGSRNCVGTKSSDLPSIKLLIIIPSYPYMKRVHFVKERIITMKVSYIIIFIILWYYSSVTSEADGLVNKVSMFDKDMMILIVFGLRGLSHEDEAQHALLCAFTLKDKIVDENISNVSIGITSGKILGFSILATLSPRLWRSPK